MVATDTRVRVGRLADWQSGPALTVSTLIGMISRWLPLRRLADCIIRDEVKVALQMHCSAADDSLQYEAARVNVNKILRSLLTSGLIDCQRTMNPCEARAEAVTIYDECWHGLHNSVLTMPVQELRLCFLIVSVGFLFALSHAAVSGTGNSLMLAYHGQALTYRVRKKRDPRTHGHNLVKF